jgi:hypothetical protein
MDNTERSQLHNKATRIMRDVAVLLLAAAVYTTQQCIDNMHIQEDSGTTNNQEKASGDSDCFMSGRSCYK